MKKETGGVGHSQEHEIRVEKVRKLQGQGLSPWPAFKSVDATCAQIVDEFHQDRESRAYAVAGRVMSIREHGKTIFVHIQDQSGKLQLYIKSQEVGDEQFALFKEFVDVGDILWTSGTSFMTKMGETTLKVGMFTLVSKSLHPLPEKFHGLVDVETKYRQRYLDLITNPESTERFVKRSHIIRYMRRFLDEHGFLEVETPMLHPIPGGATARPFVTHHNALNLDLYLRIAPELYLKRLIVGGLERVYEINRCFRNEGISTRHNPEFTTIEMYVAYRDYHWMMDFCEEMIRYIIQHVCQTLDLPFGNATLHFHTPFARMTMQEAVIRYTGCTEQDLQEDRIDQALARHKLKLDKHASWGKKLYELFDRLVEHQLIQPTFITQFPVEVSPLAKRNPEDERFVDRFELFIAGMELANAFNELNDPFDQSERFKAQLEQKEAGDEEAHAYDADYILALEYALPPTVGFAIGIDRFTMLLTNTTSIKDVILFPTLKPRSSDED